MPRNFLPRPRLVERLNEGLHRPLTLVSAAAGYGKTTLVTSWLDGLARETAVGRPVPAAWISLDEHDGDLGIFLRYFIAGLRTMFAGACAGTLELLQARQRPPLDLLFATVSNEIAGLPRDFVLVLDDHQAIGGTDVPELLGDLLRHWPQPMHLVLISRHDPTLPLASLRAKGQLTEIRTRELRFTPEEAAQYLNQTLPAPLDGPAGELLDSHFEGWIAGLQLAGLSLRSAEDPEAVLAGLSSIDVDFAGYLLAEVLVQQPAPVVAFLLQTAILDQFCGPLCEAVICDEDPEWNTKRCIEWLERMNLFIVPLDGQKEWYRYHQIFGSLLRRRALAELGPECLIGLQRKAAGWFAGRGLMEEALRYALAANDFELAGRLIEQGLRDVLNREDRPTLDRWLQVLPEELVQARPGLLMAKAWSLQMSWQLGAQVKVLRRISALVEQGSSATLAAEQLAILRAQMAELAGQEAYFNNQYGRAIDCFQEALALTPESWLYVRSGTMLYLAASMQASGHGQAAERLLIEDYESLANKTGTYGLRLLLALCFVYYAEAADLERVRRAAQRMIEGAERSGLAVMRSWGLYFLGLVHYQRNELPAAQEQLAKLLDYPYTAQLGALRDGALRLAQIQQSLGQAAEALRTADFLDQLDLDQVGRESDETAALRACVRLIQGDGEGAARWADAFNDPVPDRAQPFQFSPHKLRARILIARGAAADLQVALQLLDALADIAERSHNTRLKIEVLALRSLALRAAGQAGEARAALRMAVELARPGGFLRPFVDLGRPMYEALFELAGQDGASLAQIVGSILAAFPEQGAGPQPAPPLPPLARPVTLTSPIGPQPLIEPLTARELEVLKLMREPLSAKEIARQLHISYQTVRRHSANIFGKLDVNKRWAAVAKAEALGLLPPR